MFNNNAEALDAIAEEQGWDDASTISILVDYIDSLVDADAFENYLRERQAQENTPSQEEQPAGRHRRAKPAPKERSAMTYRTHMTNASSIQVQTGTVGDVDDALGFEHGEDESDTVVVVLNDMDNGEAWVLNTNTDDLRALAKRLIEVADALVGLD